MNLFGRRARIVELPSGSGALATGLYVGSYAGLASSGWGADGGAATDGGDQPVSVGHDDGAQIAPDTTAGSASEGAAEAASQPAIDTTWSGNDGSGGGDWWAGGGEFSGGWSGGDGGG